MTVTITMPSGRQETCSKPGTCRRHAPHAKEAGEGAAAFMREVQAAAAPKREAKVITRKQPTPIRVRQSNLREVYDTVSYSSQADEPNHLFAMDIDYTAGDGDYYGGGTGDRINSAGILRVRDLKGILLRVFQVNDRRQLPQGLIDYAEAEGLDKPEAYEVRLHEAWDGYYGWEEDDTYSVDLTEESKQKLETWFYNQPNAYDRQGILAYCRGRGVDTTGLTPFEAAKHTLLAEHPGAAGRLRHAKNVTLRTLQRGQIDNVAEARLANAHKVPEDSWEAPNIENGERIPTITGVLYETQYRRRDGANERGPGRARPFAHSYHLVDGFNRYKASTKKRISNTYLVFSA